MKEVVKRVLKKIATFFQSAIPYSLWVRLRHTEFSVLYPNGAGLKSVQCLTLLTFIIIYYFDRKINRQNDENGIFKIEMFG